MTWGRFGESDWLLSLSDLTLGGIVDSGTRAEWTQQDAQVSVLNCRRCFNNGGEEGEDCQKMLVCS